MSTFDDFKMTSNRIFINLDGYTKRQYYYQNEAQTEFNFEGNVCKCKIDGGINDLMLENLTIDLYFECAQSRFCCQCSCCPIVPSLPTAVGLGQTGATLLLLCLCLLLFLLCTSAGILYYKANRLFQRMMVSNEHHHHPQIPLRSPPDAIWSSWVTQEQHEHARNSVISRASLPSYESAIGVLPPSYRNALAARSKSPRSMNSVVVTEL